MFLSKASATRIFFRHLCRLAILKQVTYLSIFAIYSCICILYYVCCIMSKTRQVNVTVVMVLKKKRQMSCGAKLRTFHHSSANLKNWYSRKL